MAPFKVAIIGGGLSGLTTALHLDKLGIDFILLEKGAEIAPNIGASIALFPNGLKVLNQLGAYEEFQQVSVPIAAMTVRDAKNTVIYGHRILEGIAEKSGGYSISFSERVLLLKILYGKLSAGAKDKVLTGKRVNRVEQIETMVKVHTTEGEVYDADIVVGCDGVHSFVRSEMWRWAKEDGVDVFKGDMGEECPTEYGCVFGLSTPTGALKSGNDYFVHKKGATVGVAVGPNDTPYWFMFFRLPKTHYGLDFPRFTKEDEKAICDAHADAELAENTTFGEVYKNSIMSVPTALPHHCFRRWHYKRIMMVGDAVAKMNPINGQGGCNCMETCVALVDNLSDALKAAAAADEDGKPSNEQMDAVFAQTQATRIERVRSTVAAGQTTQYMSAWSSWKWQFVDTYVAPLLPTSVFVSQTMASCKGAYESRTLRDGGIVVGSEEDKSGGGEGGQQSGAKKEGMVAKAGSRFSFFRGATKDAAPIAA